MQRDCTTKHLEMVPFKTFIHVAKLSVSLYFSNKWHQAHLAFHWLPCTDQGWKNGSALLYFPTTVQSARKLWARTHWGKASIHLFGWGFLLVLVLILFFYFFVWWGCFGFCFVLFLCLNFFFFLMGGLILLCFVAVFCGFYMPLC